MTQDRVEHHVVWHCSLLSSSEHGSLLESDEGYRLQGVVVVPLGDVPCHIEYAVVADRDWRPSEARAVIVTPAGVREIVLRSACHQYRSDPPAQARSRRDREHHRGLDTVS